MNGNASAVRYVNPGEVILQIPTESGTGPATLALRTSDGRTRHYSITVDAFAPALKTGQPLPSGEQNYISAHFSDGAEVGLPTEGRKFRRAKPGELITFYGVGFGPLQNPLATGQIASGSNSLANAVTFRIGRAMVRPSYAGAAPGLVGVYQFNVTVPPEAGAGDVPVAAAVGGVWTAQPLLLPVEERVEKSE